MHRGLSTVLVRFYVRISGEDIGVIIYVFLNVKQTFCHFLTLHLEKIVEDILLPDVFRKQKRTTFSALIFSLNYFLIA